MVKIHSDDPKKSRMYHLTYLTIYLFTSIILISHLISLDSYIGLDGFYKESGFGLCVESESDQCEDAALVMFDQAKYHISNICFKIMTVSSYFFLRIYI